MWDEDVSSLAEVGLLWEEGPEPAFVPPGNFRKFLERYPNDIRKYAEIAANHYKLDLPNDSFDHLEHLHK